MNNFTFTAFTSYSMIKSLNMIKQKNNSTFQIRRAKFSTYCKANRISVIVKCRCLFKLLWADLFFVYG
jgi:hypothetical protein